MGNMMCCCKARYKEHEDKGNRIDNTSSIPEYTCEDEETIEQDINKRKPQKSDKLLNTNNTSSNNKDKQVPEDNNFNKQNFNPNDDNNNPINIPITKKQRISLYNFNTFGDKDKNNTKQLQPQDDIDSDAQTKGTMSKDAFSMRQLAAKYYIKVDIEHLELYSRCDNFALNFKPFLEVQFENQEAKIFKPSDDEESRCITDLDLTSINSTNMPFGRLSTSTCIKKEKTVTFKSSQIFEIKSQNIFSNIVFKLKTEAIKDLCQIAIAESQVPIIMLFNHYKEIPFDGNLEMKQRSNTFIGYLKVNIILSESNVFEDVMGKLQKAKFFEEYDDKNNADDNSGRMRMLLNVWEHNYINLEDMDSNIIDKYFITNYDDKERQIVDSCSIPKKYDSKLNENNLYKIFNQFVKSNGNQLALYQLIMLLVKICQKEQYTIVFNLLQLLKQDEINIFYDLVLKFSNNPFIVKYFLILYFNLVKFFKTNKVKFLIKFSP
jgi:hypothetical protein